MSNLEQALQLNLFEELDSLPKEFEEYTFSEEYEKYIKRLFDKMRGDKMHRFTKKTATIILIAAILFALIIVGFAAIVQSDFSTVFFKDHFEYRINDWRNSKKVTDLQIGYIPEGFELEKEEYNIGAYENTFICNDCELIISKLRLNTSMGFHYNEDCIVEKIEKNGIQYTFVQTDYGDNFIVWNNGDYIYRVIGNMEKEELFKIALEVE